MGRWRERGLLLSRELEALGKGETMARGHLDCEAGVGGWGVSVQDERINNNDSGEDSLLYFTLVTIQRTSVANECAVPSDRAQMVDSHTNGVSSR